MSATHFLMGSERSGSNLLTSLLGAHSQILAGSPLHLIRTAVFSALSYGDLGKEENWNELVSHVAELYRNSLGADHPDLDIERLVEDVQGNTLSALIQRVVQGERTSSGKPISFIKENQTHKLLPFLLRAFPEARYVYLVRDPRDVVASHVATALRSDSVVEATRIWKNDQVDTLIACSGLMDGKVYGNKWVQVLRYEDLIGSPGEELQRCCAFLGVEYEPAMMGFHEDPDTQARAQGIDAWRNLSRPVDGANSGKYKQVLSDEEVQYVENVCREEMDLFGYEAEHPDTDNIEELGERISQHAPRRSDSSVISDAERERRRLHKGAVQRMRARPWVPGLFSEGGEPSR